MKKITAVVLALALAFGTMFSLAVSANAASISKNKHIATDVMGGQTIYITTNTGWNTELFGNTFRTKVQISLGDDYQVFQHILSTDYIGYFQVKTYKNVNGKWVYQSNLSGKFNTRSSNPYLANPNNLASSKTFVLPGKGIKYKMVVSPIITDNTREYGYIYKASDMKDITVKITSYGTITKVA